MRGTETSFANGDMSVGSHRNAVNKAHVGCIFGILVENSELPATDPMRMYNGGAVFGGDNVRDETGSWALVQDLG